MTDGSLARAFTGGFEKLAASVNRMVMTSGGVLSLGSVELPSCQPLQIHVICDVFRWAAQARAIVFCGSGVCETLTAASGAEWKTKVFLTYHMLSASKPHPPPGSYFTSTAAASLRNQGSPHSIMTSVSTRADDCGALYNLSSFAPNHSIFCSKSHESYLLTWSRSAGGVPGTAATRLAAIAALRAMGPMHACSS